jgi:hypothetical protein
MIKIFRKKAIANFRDSRKPEKIHVFASRIWDLVAAALYIKKRPELAKLAKWLEN